MTLISEPPEGYELLPSEGDEAVVPEDVRFRAPDGEIVTLAELVAAGLIDA